MPADQGETKAGFARHHGIQKKSINEVRLSQRRRIAINNTPGDSPSWDYIYRKGDNERFVRNRQVDSTKGKFQLPRTSPIPPDLPPLSQVQIDDRNERRCAAMNGSQSPNILLIMADQTIGIRLVTGFRSIRSSSKPAANGRQRRSL